MLYVISCLVGGGEVCFSFLMRELRVDFADIVHRLHLQRVVEQLLMYR